MSSGTVSLVLHCLQLTRITFFIRLPGRKSWALERNVPSHLRLTARYDVAVSRLVETPP